MEEKIFVKGAKTHNLKNINVELPRGKLICITGVSGSGKSTLAFDTIFAEGQRRYIESLSSYARQFLGQLNKPDVEAITGLSPAVAIDQKTTSRNPRSTVGTVTEIHDYLRLLYAHTGVQHCPVCDDVVEKQTPQNIVTTIQNFKTGTRVHISANIVDGRKGEHKSVFEKLVADGYSRVRVNGEIKNLSDNIECEKNKKHVIDVIVDRLVIKDNLGTRLTDSVETALKLGDGLVKVEQVDKEGNIVEENIYSQHLTCLKDGLSFRELEAKMFSFNAPDGACTYCSGLGVGLEVDAELLIVNDTMSLSEGVIAPWSAGRLGKYFTNMFNSLSVVFNKKFDLTTPWKDIPKEIQQFILYGNKSIPVRYTNRWGREVAYQAQFKGAALWVKDKYNETDSPTRRENLSQYMSAKSCTHCNGSRLKPEILAVRVGDKNIAELSNMPIVDLEKWFNSLTLDETKQKIAERVLKETTSRIGFLTGVGLGYLNLARSAVSLSGGEAQRIRLATQIGAGLVGVLYVLDEPSIGLHPKDNDRLLESLLKLRDLGNTLIVVEHDEDTVRAADWVCEIGPRAGAHGGEVTYNGPGGQAVINSDTLTGRWLRGELQYPKPRRRKITRTHNKIKIVKASENNLKNLNVTIPLNRFVCVSGVSGSGKSSLINEVLTKKAQRELSKMKVAVGKHQKIEGFEHLDKLIHINQSPIGRTPRSNPATYVGIFDIIRTLYSQLPQAQTRGYGPGRFSFNVSGGRCEICKGDGEVKVVMNFLPDVWVQCETCEGKRYNEPTLEIKYNNKNIADVLALTVDEALEFFSAHPRIKRGLDTLSRTGLGYIKLGQAATTLSGGEAMRIKLANELKRQSHGKTLYVLDEPTTGLHADDVRKLIEILQQLVDKNNSVVVIEHNTDVIFQADWLIDLGPEGGRAGGEIVAAGTINDFLTKYETATAVALQKHYSQA